MVTVRFVKVRPLRLLEPSTLHASPGVRKQEARIKKRALNLRDIFFAHYGRLAGIDKVDYLFG